MENNIDTSGEDRLRLLEAQVLYFYRELEDMFLEAEYADIYNTYKILKKYQKHFGIHHSRIVE